jgi:hypothetical protein
LTIISGVGVGPFTLGGGGSNPIIKAWAFPVFNLVNEFFEELHTNWCED